MIDRRTLLGGALGLMSATTLLGCTDAADSDRAGGSSVPDSWFRARISTPTAIDPMLVSDRAGLEVLRYLFTPLLAHVDGELVPAAARSFTVSEDARTFTFHLREGATFHNAEVVTASGFKRAWERLVAGPSRLAAANLDEGGGEPAKLEAGEVDGARSPWARLLGMVEGYDALSQGRASEMVGLRCPDDLTLEVSLTKPFAGFADIVAHPALGPTPASSVAEASSYASKPIGNGPFRLKNEWKPASDLRFSAFSDCVVPAAGAGAVLSCIDDTASAYNQYLAGSLDFCEVPVDQLEDALKSAGESEEAGAFVPGARCTAPLGSRITYMALNASEGLMANPELRRAASYAIDRDALVRNVLSGGGATASCLVGPAIADVAAWEQCQYDPELAQQLVDDLAAAHDAPAQALSTGSSQDGELAEAVAEPLDLTLRLVFRKGGMHSKLASRIAADLEAVGFAVKTEALSGEELRARVAEGSYECALTTFEPAVPSLELAVAPLLGEEPACGALAATAADAAVTEALSTARGEIDRAARAEAVARALAHLGEELILVPVVFTMAHMVASSRISSGRLDALGSIDPASVSVL